MRHTKTGKDGTAQSYDSSVAAPNVKTRSEGTETFYENYSLPVVGGFGFVALTTAELPAAPPTGTTFFDTTLGSLVVWTGAAYEKAGGLGSIDWKSGTETGFHSIGIEDNATGPTLEITDQNFNVTGASPGIRTIPEADSETQTIGFRNAAGSNKGGMQYDVTDKTLDFVIEQVSEMQYDADLDSWNLTANALWLTGGIYPGGSTGPVWTTGSGTPEGAVTADVGSLFTRTDGGASTTLYVKESGTGNTGWVAK